jgi:hypothetical protein
MSEPGSDFYVNYLPVPPGLIRFLRRLAIAAAVAAFGVAVAVAVVQRPLPSGAFEYGVERPFEGILYERPVPVLRLTEADRVSSLVVVGLGKHGLPAVARGADGCEVRFSGSLVVREQMTMVEVDDPAAFEIGDCSAATIERGIRTVGSMTVVGELVDTKCYFGVMKPATGKVHRACAIRCLSGGVPPGILLRTDGDDGVVLLLAGPVGEALDFDVQWAARQVRANGVLEIHDQLPVLRVRSIVPVD